MDSIGPADPAMVLGQVDLFSALDPIALNALAQRTRTLDLPAGVTLFRQGDEGDAMFVIADGRVQVHVERTVFNELGRHQAFGEYALLDTMVRTASVSTVEPTRLLVIQKQDFLDLIHNHDAAMTGIVRGLIGRITKEKDRSDRLLQSILPREIAQEYKQTGQVKVRRYELVTVMFTDFAGFTRVSEDHPPERVIDELNLCFSAFDKITDQYQIQKIKTMGDGYMCVGGVPNANRTNPVDVVLAGLEIQDYMERLHAQRKAEGMEYWRCRMGIISGDCFAAVIGSSKLTYDVWSDTVNAGSRLEAGGAPGQVTIGEATFRLIDGLFHCEFRGHIGGKGKNDIPVYVVHGIPQDLSVDHRGRKPNDAFRKLCEQRFGTAC